MMESHDETPLIGENDMIIISSREQVAKKQALVTAEKGMILVSIKARCDIHHDGLFDLSAFLLCF